MHSFEINTSNVPAFLIKLWKLVEDPSCDDLIAWSDNGLSFIIKDQAKFASELLPQYFKHSNMASFVRQLNMYGFRKVMNYERSGLRTDNNEMEFQHAFFLRDQSDLLEHIKRKIPNTRVIAEPHMKSNAKDILTDLTSIRDKQDSMDNMLMKMKQENELLWKELTSMRQKHKQQEQVIEKVIHFLVQVIRNQPVGVGIQRTPRMIHDSPSNCKGKSSQIATVDYLRKNPECIVVQEKTSPTPVIHEVEEFSVEEPLSVGSTDKPSSSKNLAPVPCNKAPNIISLSPAIKSTTNNKAAANDANKEQLDASNLSSPIDISSPIEYVLPLDPLSILEPLQTSSPTVNDANEDDAVSGIPLEYVTASDVAKSLNSTSSTDVIAIPSRSIMRNVISVPDKKVPITFPEEVDICNVISIPDDGNIISIPESSEVSNVITIPEGTDISNVITIPEGSDITEIFTDSNTQNIKKTCNSPAPSAEAVKSPEKVENPMAMADFYDPSCLDDLKTNSIEAVKSPLAIISKHDFVDPLMSDSLNTPKVSLNEDIAASDFNFGNCKKQTPSSVAEREHDYPSSSSSSSAAANETKASNANGRSLEEVSDRIARSLKQNTLSNHLLIVEEELNRLQDNIATNSWDVDTDKLLGLFSSDGMVSNDSLVDQLTEGISIKKEPEDILDDDLIQLTPQMLGVDIDELQSPFLEHLDPTLSHTDNLPEMLPDKKSDLLEDVLGGTTAQDALLSDSAFLNNDETSSPNKRRRNSKTTRGKRRKLK